MSRKQRVVFRAEIQIVIDAPWSPDCTIAQVMKQAEEDARQALDRLRGGPILLPPSPTLVRVILDEDTEVTNGS